MAESHVRIPPGFISPPAHHRAEAQLWYFRDVVGIWREPRGEVDYPWLTELVVHQRGASGKSPQLRLHSHWPEHIPEVLGKKLTAALQEYLTTTVLTSTRHLIFEAVVKKLRDHDVQLRRLTEWQGSVLERIARLEAGSTVAGSVPEIVLESETIVPIAEAAAEKFGLDAEVSLVEATLSFVLPPAQEEALVQKEFELYRELAASLPLDVYRVLQFDIDVKDQ